MMTGKKAIFFSFTMAVAGLALLYAYMLAVSPQAIRTPRLEHAHFRMQLFVDGQSVDFAEEKFQRPTPNACSDALPEEPIHFHDRKNQFVHLHWKHVTGGLVLKNYGWNLIGGKDGLLGYRMDRTPLVQNRVQIYGNVLPAYPEGAELWVYSGNKGAFVQRPAGNFLEQDLETFFGTKSSVSVSQPDFWRDLLFARGSAHEGHDHAEAAPVPTSASGPVAPQTKSEAELSRINNLLGNVVVFAQKNKPTDVQVKDAFDRLEPLTDSTCGG